MSRISDKTREELQNGCNYDYISKMCEDICDYIDSERSYIINKYSPVEYNINDWLEDVSEYLSDELLNCDYIAGNASGSYTFSRYDAKLCVINCTDELYNVIDNDFASYEQIGRYFINNDWEKIDVLIRCYIYTDYYQNQLLNDSNILKHLVDVYIAEIQTTYNQ